MKTSIVPLIVCLAVLILGLGFSMNFGWDWIKLLGIFLIAGIITSPLSWSILLRKMIRESQNKQGKEEARN